MTYNEIYTTCRLVLSNIRLGSAEFKCSNKLATSLIMLQVEYEAKIDEFESLMSKVFDKMKGDGFDERAIKYRNAEDVRTRLAHYEQWEKDGRVGECPVAKPTESEILIANSARADDPGFPEELGELERMYQDARLSKASEDVGVDMRKLTRSEYEELVSCIGISGDIDLYVSGSGASKMKKVDFLRIIAKTIVE